MFPVAGYNKHTIFYVRPARVVSLVPSVTEALFSLGLGERVVGRTDWCTRPGNKLRNIPRVGEPRNPNLAKIIALEPAIVIADQAGTSRADIEALEAKGIPVWVTFPKTVKDGIAILQDLLRLFQTPAENIKQMLAPLEKLREKRENLDVANVRVFCPVSRDPWTSIGRATYIHDMLSLCGGINIFAEHRDRHLPKVTEEEIIAAQPEVVILPNTPCSFAASYLFSTKDVQEIERWKIPAAPRRRIHVVDGTLLTWYGPSIVRAFQQLPPLLSLEKA